MVVIPSVVVGGGGTTSKYYVAIRLNWRKKSYNHCLWWIGPKSNGFLIAIATLFYKVCGSQFNALFWSQHPAPSPFGGLDFGSAKLPNVGTHSCCRAAKSLFRFDILMSWLLSKLHKIGLKPLRRNNPKSWDFPACGIILTLNDARDKKCHFNYMLMCIACPEQLADLELSVTEVQGHIDGRNDMLMQVIIEGKSEEWGGVVRSTRCYQTCPFFFVPFKLDTCSLSLAAF